MRKIRKLGIVQAAATIALATQAYAGSYDSSPQGQGVASRVAQSSATKDSRKDIVFLGDSITAGGTWNQFFPEHRALNRGISGDTTQAIFDRLHTLYALNPRILFLLVGVNDLNAQVAMAKTVENYRAILQQLKQNLPATEIYVQSVLPVDDRCCFANNRDIKRLNEQLRVLAQELELKYIDLYPAFTDADGQLRRRLSHDGIHLLAAGYRLWVKQIAPVVEKHLNE